MQYLVEVGKDKGAYKTRYKFDGLQSAGRAIMHFNCLNTHSGHKKRLVAVHEDGRREIMARVLT